MLYVCRLAKAALQEHIPQIIIQDNHRYHQGAFHLKINEKPKSVYTEIHKTTNISYLHFLSGIIMKFPASGRTHTSNKFISVLSLFRRLYNGECHHLHSHYFLAGKYNTHLFDVTTFLLCILNSRRSAKVVFFTFSCNGWCKNNVMPSVDDGIQIKLLAMTE